VDIFAERAADLGPDLTLVQVKHPDEGNKVGEPTVKLRQREVMVRGATRGLVATTATFTSTALKLIEEFKYTMSAADHEKLQQWLKDQRSALNARP
jgi:restriction endonuclease Mrr